ncbi:MAG: hypothetical protein J7641_04700 [Cyanobacteria bacterium SID2]|nr:hypothetical protein [Cyanobacteria bacterium SID2]MBP0005248.1 hypothetical protein [Cyanobacteria bacterium SBC]
MSTATALANAPDVTPEDYVVLGLAVCFIREDDEIVPLQVVEPIPSSALEALLKGIPTSYKSAYALTVGDLFEDDTLQIPEVFPSECQFGHDFVERLIASVRTYQKRPEACKHIAIGATFEGFNHNLDRKRLLNIERVITTEDNVKQHRYTHEVL